MKDIITGPDGLVRSIHARARELDTGALVPVYRSVLTTRYHNGCKYQRTTLPLQLCTAITAHRSQGIYDSPRPCASTPQGVGLPRPVIVYVMVTRVKHRRLLN